MAIKIEELRPGNVFWDSYGGYNVVTGIGYNNVGPAPKTVLARHIRGNVSGSFHCEHISGVPLSAEVLEACGFKISDSGDNWKEPDYKIWSGVLLIGEKDGKFYLYNQCEDDFYSWYYPQINFLHELQNIQFALNKKELTYNPKH